jgi:hypothetical protein
MKNHLFWLLFVMAGVVSIGITSKSASAHIPSQEQYVMQKASNLQVDQTPIPTAAASMVAVENPESRILPPVGNNAGLVLGASVLVLIIIGAVIGLRRREKH